jgi:hypothetical protein
MSFLRIWLVCFVLLTFGQVPPASAGLASLCKACLAGISRYCGLAEFNPASEKFSAQAFDVAELDGKVTRALDVPTLIFGTEMPLKNALSEKQITLAESFPGTPWTKYWMVLRETEPYLYSFYREYAGDWRPKSFYRGGSSFLTFYVEDGKIFIDQDHGWRTDSMNRLDGQQESRETDFLKRIDFAVKETGRLTGHSDFQLEPKRTTSWHNNTVAGYSANETKIHTYVDIPANEDGLIFLNLMERFWNLNYIKEKRPITLFEVLHKPIRPYWFETPEGSYE